MKEEHESETKGHNTSTMPVPKLVKGDPGRQVFNAPNGEDANSNKAISDSGWVRGQVALQMPLASQQHLRDTTV